MIRNLLITILLLAILSTQAQSIRGSIVNPRGESIAGAQLSVTHLRKSLVLWEGQSDSAGRFSLPPMELKDSLGLSVFHYEYELYVQLLPTNHQELQVTMIPSSVAHQISEVTVIGHAKPMYFDKGDLVVDVARVTNFERLSTKQLINRIPGLFVDGEQVMFKNSPVVIYINGSKPTIPASEVLKYIESLPAGAVEELRLIPMPSNRYGGAEAVIDIKIKSLSPDDFYSKTTANGSVVGSLLGGGVEEFLMFRKKNITFNTNLSLYDAKSYSKSVDNNYIEKPDITIFSPTEIKEDRKVINSSSNLTVDMKNNSNMDFNLFIYYDQNKKDRDWSYTENSQPTKQYYGNIEGNDDMYSLAAKYSTDEAKKHAFSVGYSGMYGSLNNSGNYFLQNDKEVYNGYLTTDYSMRGHIHNLTADGTSKFLDGKLQLKYGIYADANFLSDNTYDYDYGTSALKSSNQFTANEFNLRGYVRIDRIISEDQGLSFDIGYYQTIYKYDTDINTSGDEFKNSYGNFVPNFTYWLLSTNYRLILNLITSTDRPHYTYLLPGKRYISNYGYTVGNPNLASVTSYDLKLNQLFWDILAFDMRTRLSQNDINLYMNVDSDGLIESTRNNTSDRLFYEASLVIPFQTSNKKFYGSLYGALFGNYYFNVNPTLGMGFVTKNTFAGVARVNMYYDITKRLSLEGSFRWRSKREGFQSVTSEYYDLSVGASYAFLKNKALIVNVRARDFIKGLQAYAYDSYVAGNYFENQRTRVPFIELSVSYIFSKGKDVKYRNNQGDFSRMMP